MQHGVAFAREQGVDADAGFGGDFFEAAAFYLVGEEDFALVGGELFEGLVEGGEKEAVEVGSVGAVVG